MANTIYATFPDPANAERAAGALLDFGAKPEDISLVRKQSAATTSNTAATSPAASEERPVPHEETMIGNRSGDPIGSGFGADMTAMHYDVEHPRMDAQGVAGETEMRHPPQESYAAGSARVSDENYENLTVYGDDGESQANSEHNSERAAKAGITTTTAADAGAGAIKGSGIGLGVGAIAAIAALFIPGVGIVAGGGALAIALGAAAATAGAGAVAGAVTGYLKDQGMDEPTARSYETTIEGGGAMLAISVPSAKVDEMTIRSVLDKYGATNVTAPTSSGGFLA